MTYQDYCNLIERSPFSVLGEAAKQQIKNWILSALQEGFNNGYEQRKKDEKALKRKTK